MRLGFRHAAWNTYRVVCLGFRHAAWMPKNVFVHDIPPRGPYALLCGAEKLEEFMTCVFCTVTAGPCGWRGTPHTHSPGAPATSEEGATPSASPNLQVIGAPINTVRAITNPAH